MHIHTHTHTQSTLQRQRSAYGGASTSTSDTRQLVKVRNHSQNNESNKVIDSMLGLILHVTLSMPSCAVDHCQDS